MLLINKKILSYSRVRNILLHFCSIYKLVDIYLYHTEPTSTFKLIRSWYISLFKLEFLIRLGGSDQKSEGNKP